MTRLPNGLIRAPSGGMYDTYDLPLGYDPRFFPGYRMSPTDPRILGRGPNTENLSNRARAMPLPLPPGLLNQLFEKEQPVQGPPLPPGYKPDVDTGMMYGPPLPPAAVKDMGTVQGPPVPPDIQSVQHPFAAGVGGPLNPPGARDEMFPPLSPQAQARARAAEEFNRLQAVRDRFAERRREGETAREARIAAMREGAQAFADQPGYKEIIGPDGGVSFSSSGTPGTFSDIDVDRAIQMASRNSNTLSEMMVDLKRNHPEAYEEAQRRLAARREGPVQGPPRLIRHVGPELSPEERAARMHPRKLLNMRQRGEPLTAEQAGRLEQYLAGKAEYAERARARRQAVLDERQRRDEALGSSEQELMDLARRTPEAARILAQSRIAREGFRQTAEQRKEELAYKRNRDREIDALTREERSLDAERFDIMRARQKAESDREQGNFEASIKAKKKADKRSNALKKKELELQKKRISLEEDEIDRQIEESEKDDITNAAANQLALDKINLQEYEEIVNTGKIPDYLKDKIGDPTVVPRKLRERWQALRDASPDLQTFLLKVPMRDITTNEAAFKSFIKEEGTTKLRQALSYGAYLGGSDEVDRLNDISEMLGLPARASGGLFSHGSSKFNIVDWGVRALEDAGIIEPAEIK